MITKTGEFVWLRNDKILEHIMWNLNLMLIYRKISFFYYYYA